MTVLSTGHDIEILITETEIAARTTQLARMIKEQYRDTEQLVVVGLLRGSFVFIADLVRRLDLPVEVDFMTVSSYGDKMESSRQVRIIQDLETPIKRRDVLIVEDIIDTGHTLSQVYDILETREPRSLPEVKTSATWRRRGRRRAGDARRARALSVGAWRPSPRR